MRARFVAAIVGGVWLTAVPAVAQQAAPPDLFLAGPETYAPRYEPGRDQAPTTPIIDGIVIIEPPRRQNESSEAAQRPERSRGFLSLIVEPVTAQIYVDGFFMGMVDDYRGTPGPLVEAGTHRVELRASGYETAAFDVRVAAGQVVTLRRNLVRAGDPAPSAAHPPAPVAPARAGRTFYVIPRCYAGDAPPRPAHLPAGCDITRLRTVPALGEPDQPAR